MITQSITFREIIIVINKKLKKKKNGEEFEENNEILNHQEKKIKQYEYQGVLNQKRNSARNGDRNKLTNDNKILQSKKNYLRNVDLELENLLKSSDSNSNQGSQDSSRRNQNSFSHDPISFQNKIIENEENSNHKNEYEIDENEDNEHGNDFENDSENERNEYEYKYYNGNENEENLNFVNENEIKKNHESKEKTNGNYNENGNKNDDQEKNNLIQMDNEEYYKVLSGKFESKKNEGIEKLKIEYDFVQKKKIYSIIKKNKLESDKRIHQIQNLLESEIQNNKNLQEKILKLESQFSLSKINKDKDQQN